MSATAVAELPKIDPSQAKELSARLPGVRTDHLLGLPYREASIVRLGERSLALLKRIYNAAPEDRKRDAIGFMFRHPGAFHILADFLAVAGTDNLFEAPKRVRIEQAATLTEKGERVALGGAGRLVRSGGYVISRLEGQTKPLILQQRAFVSLLALLNPESDDPLATAKERIRERNSLSIKDILLNPNDVPKERAIEDSVLVRQRRDLVESLQKAAEGLASGLSSIGVALGPQGKELLKSLLYMDRGGGFLGWFDRQDNLPNTIQEALSIARDPVMTLSDVERRLVLQGLMSYWLDHQYIDKEYALAGIRKDLQRYETERGPHPQRQHVDQHLNSGDEGLITLADYNRIQNTLNLTPFRIEHNRTLMRQYGRDFARLEREARSLFTVDDQPTEDLTATVVPMHFRSSPLGKKYRSKDPVVNSEEYALLRRVATMSVTAKTDDLRMGFFPTSEFQEIVERGVVVARKLQASKILLRLGGIDPYAPAPQEVPDLPRGTNFMLLSEAYELQTGAATYGISVSEMLRRAAYASDQTRSETRQLRLATAAGLATEAANDKASIGVWFRQAKGLTSALELRDEIAMARRVDPRDRSFKGSRLTHINSLTSPNLDRRYFDWQEASTIRNMAKAALVFIPVSEDGNEELPQLSREEESVLAGELENLRGSVFVWDNRQKGGEIESGNYPRLAKKPTFAGLKLLHVSARQETPSERYDYDSHGVSLHNPFTLRVALKNIDELFRRVTPDEVRALRRAVGRHSMPDIPTDEKAKVYVAKRLLEKYGI